MRKSGFLLFRLNFVDRDDLFQNPIRTDADFQRVIELATSQDFDVPKQGRRSAYTWALREVSSGVTEEAERPFIFGVFSHQISSRKGPIVTPRGIMRGTSIVNPPSATLARLFIDLRRHILCIEEIPAIIKPNGGWKSSLQNILDAAAWRLEYTSVIRLDPIIPTEIVETGIKSFERITRLRVTLRIPNPDLSPSFQKLYDEMRNGGVRELTEDMRNEQGLKLAPETLPQSTLEMAMSGYRKGKIHIYGLRDGGRDEFTIANDVARVEIDDLGGFVEGYAEASRSSAVKKFAQAIFARIDVVANKTIGQ